MRQIGSAVVCTSARLVVCNDFPSTLPGTLAPLFLALAIAPGYVAGNATGSPIGCGFVACVVVTSFRVKLVRCSTI